MITGDKKVRHFANQEEILPPFACKWSTSGLVDKPSAIYKAVVMSHDPGQDSTPYIRL